MAKGSTVRGTPVTHIGPSVTNDGYATDSLSGYSGTVSKQYGNMSTAPGTPYTSKDGDPADARRVVSQDKNGGHVTSEYGVNHNDPHANGNGVVFDGVSRSDAYAVRGSHTSDSPVPDHAPVFNPADMVRENRAHLGYGSTASDAMVRDDLDAIGGVMSRGMPNMSKPAGGEREMLLDDVDMSRRGPKA